MVEATQESTQEPKSAAAQAEPWDISQYEDALKHLESLQEQVRIPAIDYSYREQRSNETFRLII